MAVDAAGNAYVTGTVTSTDFPTSPGAVDPSCGSDGACGGQPLPDGLVTLVPPADIFVAKLNPEGTELVYSTYLGGGLWESANAIAVDPAGNAYVAGWSDSPDYPTTAGAPQPGCGSDGTCNRTPDGYTLSDAVLSKLNADGTDLVYSTFLGGSGYDQASGLALDAAGNAYVGGMTISPDFPTTSGAFRTEPLPPDCGTEIGWLPCYQGFVAKVDATGTSLVYSTFLGGSSDLVTAVAADAAGHAYVTGMTQSETFPTTPGAFQRDFGGGPCSMEVIVFPCPDAFVAELDLTGANMVYASFLGGVETDLAGGIAVDPAGRIYVSGTTQSSNFPTTPGAFQTALKGGECAAPLGASTECPDAFVAKFDPTAAGPESLVYSTLLGGQGGEYGAGLTVDAAGHAYLTGMTASQDFPTVNPIQAASAGEPDAFVTELDLAGSALLFSTYLGGSSYEGGTALAVDSSGDIFVSGYTYGGMPPGIGFPTTPGSFINGPHSGTLGFLSKIAPTDAPAVILDPTVMSFSDQVVSTTSASQTVTLRTLGSAPVSITDITTTGEFSQTNDCVPGIDGGQTCSIQVTFTPSTTDLESGELRVSDTAPGNPHTVALVGNNGVTSIGITPIDIDIGPVEVGETSGVETITITNTGDEPMTITDIAVTGGRGFEESSTCPPTLAPGESCTISVTFTPALAGDASAQIDIYTSASSLPQTVNLSGRTADFAMLAASATLTVTAGQSAEYDLTLTPSGGFNQPVALTCSGAPQGATCTVSPNPVALSGTAAVNATARITTTGRSGAAPAGPLRPPPSLPWAGLQALTLALLASAGWSLARRQARRLKPVPVALLASTMAALLLWAACGGSQPPGNPGTPAGTYTLTVSGAAGSGTGQISHA
ncbi:MAG: SBBP repeat-containing protein, partial [Terriglobales bacterium]